MKCLLKSKNFWQEYIPLSLTFILQVVGAIIFKQSFIRTFPICFSLVIALVNSRANRYGFLLGASNCVIYAIVFFSSRLYGSFGQTLASLILQLVAFFMWNKKSYKQATVFRKLKTLWSFLLHVATIVAWLVAFYVMSKTDANMAILDSFVLIAGTACAITDIFAIVDTIVLRVLSVLCQLAMWLIIVAKGSIFDITYVIFYLYSVYMTIRLCVKWVLLYKEQKALREQKQYL